MVDTTCKQSPTGRHAPLVLGGECQHCHAVLDSRGAAPNYMFDKVKMVHQPTGLSVDLISGSDASLRIAHLTLMQLVKEASEGSADALDGAGLAGVQRLRPQNSYERARKAVVALYEEQSVGGILHIVTDDLNTEDHHLKYCGQYYDEPHPSWGRSMTDVEKECYNALLALSEEERESAILGV